MTTQSNRQSNPWVVLATSELTSVQLDSRTKRYQRRAIRVSGKDRPEAGGATGHNNKEGTGHALQ
jgi:hypothetical protein